MKESDTEGLATHGGPESCVGDSRGRGEAWTGVRVGGAMEPRNQSSWGAHAVEGTEGNTAAGVKREPVGGPTRSENPGMHGNSMRENREIPRTPAGLITGRAAQGRLRPHA